MNSVQSKTIQFIFGYKQKIKRIRKINKAKQAFGL